jgi:hypothetical protein
LSRGQPAVQGDRPGVHRGHPVVHLCQLPLSRLFGRSRVSRGLT